VVTVEEDTAAVLARVPAGRFPDGLAYVPSTGEVWVSDEAGGVETVLDARSGQPLATVPLGGEAGNVRYDPVDDRMLVDVQSRDEVAVIDPHDRAVTRRVSVPGCDRDHGLPGLDELGRLHVGEDPDVLAADPGRGVLYVAAESGVVTSVDLKTTAGRISGRAHLADEAHVVAVDPGPGRAFFPVPDAGDGRPGLLIATPTTGGAP
jgi:DNA-binding beta-propeller fold protein YncE